MSKVKRFALDGLMALMIGLAVIFAFSVVGATGQQGNDWRNHVIRLHILAADNTDAEQELKLKIRDEIWGLVRDLVADAPSMPKAKTVIAENLNLIEYEATKFASGHNVTVRLVEGLGFPPMSYAHIFLPSGDYTALQIIIGEGSGDNWWCIMFPPMCLMDVTKGQVVYLSDEEYEQITLRPRFRLAEIFR
ncbi:MAG: stage II sporulation protein R [Defluviitaleaceae bacterium]|nr:stage II sporulation protein R [Defluviitaleaceae bacterium]